MGKPYLTTFSNPFMLEITMKCQLNRMPLYISQWFNERVARDFPGGKFFWVGRSRTRKKKQITAIPINMGGYRNAALHPNSPAVQPVIPHISSIETPEETPTKPKTLPLWVFGHHWDNIETPGAHAAAFAKPFRPHGIAIDIRVLPKLVIQFRQTLMRTQIRIHNRIP